MRLYRALAMLDYCVTPEGDFSNFCTRVRRLLPEHGHLPEAKEVARMAVQSFSKPVALRQSNNAPVMGSRFREYQSIAMEMGRLLGGCEE